MTERDRYEMREAPDPLPSPLPEELAACTVLVVDDNAPNVRLLQGLLRGAGIREVHGFTDPGEAIVHCEESLPDLVLLDLQMPHLDGFGVMAALERMLPVDVLVPVLVLTADITNETKERALAAGAKDFLTKPFDRTEVILRVRNLLETRVLHRRLERHNAALRAELAEQVAREREAEAARDRSMRRIEQALGGEDVIEFVMMRAALDIDAIEQQAGEAEQQGRRPGAIE
jgi:CheY-like chemotaxis protein